MELRHPVFMHCDIRNGWVDIRNGWVDIRNGWVDLRNGWVDIRNGWVDIRNGWVDIQNGWVDIRNGWVDIRNGWVDLRVCGWMGGCSCATNIERTRTGSMIEYRCMHSVHACIEFYTCTCGLYDDI